MRASDNLYDVAALGGFALGGDPQVEEGGAYLHPWGEAIRLVKNFFSTEIQVLTASFGYYLVDHYSLIGASGGIYCLIAACVPDIIVNWKESRAVFVQVCYGEKITVCQKSMIFMFSAIQARPCGARL